MTFYCAQCAAVLPSEDALRRHLQDTHSASLASGFRPVEKPNPAKGKQERFG